MDTALKGQRMKDVVQLLWDIRSEFGEGTDGVGQYVPAVKDFGDRAEEILLSWFGNLQLGEDYPPAADVVIGFSRETREALDTMHEASNNLAELIVKDFGVFEDREGSH